MLRQGEIEIERVCRMNEIPLPGNWYASFASGPCQVVKLMRLIE